MVGLVQKGGNYEGLGRGVASGCMPRLAAAPPSHKLQRMARRHEGFVATDTTSQVDDELVEQLWLSCGLDMRILEDVKNHCHYTLLFDIVCSSYGPAIKNASPPEIRIEEDASGTLSPEVMHAFLNCLSKQNIPFGDTGRDDARSLLAQYVKSLFASRRRDLAQEPSATAPSPTPVPSLPLTPSPGTATQSAHPVPKSPSLSKPAKEPTESVLSPPPAEISHLKKAKQTPKSVAKKKSSNNISTNTVIGLCVFGVALLALVCLCCCVCCTNRSAAYDSKDDKPLLSLSLSDFSGSSRNSYSHGTPIDINKLGALSLKSEAGHDLMKLSSHGNLLMLRGIHWSVTLQPSPSMLPPVLCQEQNHHLLR